MPFAFKSALAAANLTYTQAVEAARNAAQKSQEEYLAMTKMFDPVERPAHYASGGIECIDAIKEQMPRDAYVGFLQGNVAKYVWRWRDKGGVESLEKAQYYLTRLINELKQENSNAD